MAIADRTLANKLHEELYLLRLKWRGGKPPKRVIKQMSELECSLHREDNRIREWEKMEALRAAGASFDTLAGART